MSANNINRAYSVAEEWANSLSHGIGFIATLVGLVLMLNKAEELMNQVAAAVYGGTLLLMFLSSTLYHGIPHPAGKAWLKLLDHSAIYLLIAGTYTPLTLVSIGGTLGTVMTVLVWSLAIAGVAFKMVARHRFPKLSVITYLVMGWIAASLIQPLYYSMPAAGLWLILAGGLCFSLGVAFYVAKQTPFTHCIWHLFVLGGCACHFFAIYHYVI